MSHDLESAIHRLRAVIAVLDEDIAAADRTCGSPVPRAELLPVAWKKAEAARRLVEDSLNEAERAAANAAHRARDWQEKAELALRRGDVLLARQAIAAAKTAAEEAAVLTLECNELQIFLTEWAVRVTRASSATPPEAAG